MSTPSLSQDRSVELRQLELDAAEEARVRQEAEATRRREELAQLRSGARTSAQGTAQNYFLNQGLVPGDYAGSIDTIINQIMAGITPDDPNPGSYFSNIGETVYNQEQTGSRNRALRDLDRIFAPNFDTARISDTTDDPILASVEAEQMDRADEIIRNMLSRGVITGTGATGAREELARQTPGVRARLNEIGTGQLATGRQRLRDVANRGRSTASQLSLGTQFDPYSFGGEADTAFTDWLSKLGDNIRAAAPGNLYKTDALAAAAGAKQGAQNTLFNPNALAGIIEEDEEDQQPFTGGNVF